MATPVHPLTSRELRAQAAILEEEQARLLVRYLQLLRLADELEREELEIIAHDRDLQRARHYWGHDVEPLPDHP